MLESLSPNPDERGGIQPLTDEALFYKQLHDLYTGPEDGDQIIVSMALEAYEAVRAELDREVEADEEYRKLAALREAYRHGQRVEFPWDPDDIGLS